jgi:hypothetical protein
MCSDRIAEEDKDFKAGDAKPIRIKNFRTFKCQRK